MARIAAIHGIAQQLKGAQILREEWSAPLADGLSRTPVRLLRDDDVAYAFYGGLFRSPDRVRGRGAEGETGDAADAAFDDELLARMWSAAAAAHPDRVFPPHGDLRGTSRGTQAALTALSRVPYFAGVAMDLARGDLTQVRRYMREPTLRLAAQAELDAVVTPDTRVIVAHSLGTVVAYEALHRYAAAPNWRGVTTLVTLGSPLGIRNLIFDALVPAPSDGQGRWPVLVRDWTNISDDGDVVALEKKLSARFGLRVVDIAVSNEATAHDVSPYLSATATGQAIARGLG
jgi:hypothetical protein